MGEVIFFKEFSAAHLPFEEGIQIENSGAPVGGMDGRTWRTESLDGHV